MFAEGSAPRCHRAVLGLVLAVGWWAAVLSAHAQSGGVAPPATPTARDRLKNEDLRMRGIFDSVLPETAARNSLRLILHPHFGDFHRKDYLRAPVGVRYGLTDNWEVTAAIEGYFSHGLGDAGLFEEYGLSELQVETRYRSDWSPLPGWQMASGLRYSHPLDHPPVELTDGFEHIMPSATLARPVADWPGLEVFWGTGLDLVRDTGVAGALEDNEFGDDANTLTAGFVWNRGQHTYTFETVYATTALLGDTDQHRISVRPGVIFRIPDRFTFHSRGDWRMGMALRLTDGPDGLDVGFSVKLRGDFDLKRLLGRRALPASNPVGGGTAR